MPQVFGEFISALRQADIPASPAETLDALAALRLLGMAEREPLKLALGQLLAKSEADKQRFDIVFEQYFQLLPRESDLDDPDAVAQEAAAEPLATEPLATETPAAEANAAEANVLDAAQSPLGEMLLSGDSAALDIAVAAAGREEGVSEIRSLTQRGRYSYRVMQRLGMDALNSELLALEQAQTLTAQALLENLEREKLKLQTRVRDYVEQQYLLFAQQQGQRLLDDSLQKVKLTRLDHQYYQRLEPLVRKAAKQLASQHGRRRKTSKRGFLDVRKTIAANAAFDGVQFRTHWRATRVERPKVMVICDVSGSVSRVARFLLLFLYSLQDVLPRVRSFVFASSMGEVTDAFQQEDLETALAQVMQGWANQPTDYGKALSDFSQLALDQVDHKTTVIMLGDARNNQLPGNEKVWEQVYRRSRRVLWLNPEGRSSWNSGDSIMATYAPYCSQVESCNSLRDLQRIFGALLKHS